MFGRLHFRRTMNCVNERFAEPRIESVTVRVNRDVEHTETCTDVVGTSCTFKQPNSEERESASPVQRAIVASRHLLTANLDRPMSFTLPGQRKPTRCVVWVNELVERVCFESIRHALLIQEW